MNTPAAIDTPDTPDTPDDDTQDLPSNPPPDYYPKPNDLTQGGETLVKIGQWVYVRGAYRMYSTPVCTVLYTRIGLLAELIEAWPEKYGLLGRRVEYNQTFARWQSVDEPPYCDYKRIGGPGDRAEYFENLPIPEPRQRGKACPMRYYAGYWQKETRRGWISAE